MFVFAFDFACFDSIMPAHIAILFFLSSQRNKDEHDCAEGDDDFSSNYIMEENKSYKNHWTILGHFCGIAGEGCAAAGTPFNPSHTTPVYICKEYIKRRNCCRSHVCHVCASGKMHNKRTRRGGARPSRSSR